MATDRLVGQNSNGPTQNKSAKPLTPAERAPQRATTSSKAATKNGKNAATSTASKKTPVPSKASAPAGVANGNFTVDTFMDALRQQESGGDYSSHSNSSSTASGAYQYLDSTWNNYGGYARAWQAPQAVQDARARSDIEGNYKQYGGDWRKVAAAHFAGGGWVAKHPDPATWNQNPAPGSQNPTVTGYVNSLFSKAGMKGAVSNTGGAGGGTAGGGSATDGSGGFAAAQDASPAGIKATVASNFGYLSAFMDDPEVGPILTRAAKEGWDSARLQGALFKTKFYQQHSATTRQWDAQAKLDPATAHQQVTAQVADLQAQARTLGLTIEPAKLAKVANDSLRFGWSRQQTSNSLAAEGKFDIRQGVRTAATPVANGLRQAAAQQLVPISDASLQQWVGNIQTGKVTQENFNDYLKEQAKSLFPSLTHAIDSGVTVAQYADPYKNIAAQTLELNPNDVNFTDPKWSKALFQIDPKTGARTAMSLNDWTQTLKTDPTYGYSKTHQANAQVADMATSLLSTFGKIA